MANPITIFLDWLTVIMLTRYNKHLPGQPLDKVLAIAKQKIRQVRPDYRWSNDFDETDPQ